MGSSKRRLTLKLASVSAAPSENKLFMELVWFSIDDIHTAGFLLSGHLVYLSIDHCFVISIFLYCLFYLLSTCNSAQLLSLYQLVFLPRSFLIPSSQPPSSKSASLFFQPSLDYTSVFLVPVILPLSSLLPSVSALGPLLLLIG